MNAGARGLDPGQEAALEKLLEALRAEPASVSSVRDPAEARRVHIDDSLSGLELAEVRDAARIADLGAGAGFPGLPLAVALPGARVDLIEASRRKCEFIRRAADAAGIGNVEVVCRRSEEWAAGAGRELYPVVAARAVAALAELAELASPLLAPGGALVAWRGARDLAAEEALERAAPALAMRPEKVLAVEPFAGSRYRHLHVVRKTGATPEGLPRRPGMARKRPFAAKRPQPGA